MKKDYKNSKAVVFLKKNAYYIVMVACVVAIATMVTLAIVLNGPVTGGGGDSVDKPQINEPNNPDIPGDGDIDNPGEDVDNPSVMVFGMPLNGAVVLRAYSAENAVWNPTLNHYEMHEAVDFKATAGQKVLAVYDGIVESIMTDPLNGTVLTILHKNNIRSIYGSLTNPSVKVGDSVKKGAEIGEASDSMGNEKSDGVHLHFSMSVNGETSDPNVFLADGGK